MTDEDGIRMALAEDDDLFYRALLLQFVAVFERLQVIAPTPERDEALQRLRPVRNHVAHSMHVDTETVRNAVRTEMRTLIDDIDSGSLGTAETRLLRLLAEPDLVTEALARSDQKTSGQGAGTEHWPPMTIRASGDLSTQGDPARVHRDVDPSFGVHLRQSREAAGMSLSQLAANLNYSKSYLSKVENGKKQPSRELKEWVAAIETDAQAPVTVHQVRPITAEPNSPMTFRLLGAVEMSVGDRSLELGPPQQRTVLACLAVDAGRPVSLRTLTERVWGDSPPDGARQSLYAHLARIRRLVEQADPAVTLTRSGGGYLLGVDPDRVDLHRFRRLTRGGRNDQGKPEAERAALLHMAMGLWRGVPLTGASGPWANRLRDGLVSERLDTAATWADLALRLDRPLEVITTLRDLVIEHPLSEPLVAVLMQALAAAEHATEALTLFAATRTRLAHELGADPGHELRAVHEAVLRGDVHQRQTKPPKSKPLAPTQFPADVYAFAGRERELTALNKFLKEADSPLTVVVGTAGVGKTALAVRWAHRVRDRFPDGQLYLDLRGYDSEQPLSVSDALARLLSALGLTGSEIPLDPDDRAARYRTELSDRRMLVLLDNAATSDQVRPLLPGAPGCLVMVTSRDSLAGLVARHGARRLDLNLLPRHDAVRLLGWLIGDRVAAEPAAAEALAEECARLPLALRIAAELAAARPTTPLSVLVDELADEQRRLDLLDAGADPRTAVHAVFSWSYQHLTTDAADTFRLVGLHPGQEPTNVVTTQDVRIDLGARRVLVGGAEVDLTRKEFTVLAVLAAHIGTLVTRQDLLDAGWPDTDRGRDRALSVVMTTLRKKLNRPGLIVTQHGLGYRLGEPPAIEHGAAMGSVNIVPPSAVADLHSSPNVTFSVHGANSDKV